MLKETDIVGKLMGALGNPRQNGQHPAVYLSGIRLAGYRIAPGKAHFLGNALIRLAAFLMIPIEKLQKTSLCAGSAFGA